MWKIVFVKSSTVQQRRQRILLLRKSFQVHITWHGQQQHSAINPTLNVTQACQCPRVYAVCSYRMPVEIHTIAIYSIYYNKLKLQAEPCLHVFYVRVVWNSVFIYKLNLKCVFNDVVLLCIFTDAAASHVDTYFCFVF